MTQFNIAISNCNSVDRAEVVLTKGALNIKYGPNGLGKSTLAKAIVSQIPEYVIEECVRLLPAA